jgi:hypothetical protein
MAELIQSALVEPVIPLEHVGRIPQFAEAFLQFVDRDPTVAARREVPLAQLVTLRIHIEKLDGIADELCHRRLARPSRYPWYEIEEFTARLFMAYLAASLGRLEALGFVPATDELESLALLSGEQDERSASTELRQGLRATVLEGILPAPAGGLAVSELARFKSKYGNKLNRFRTRVESFILEAAQIPDSDTRTERVQLFREELRDEIGELRARMSQRGWHRIHLGTLLTLLAPAIAGPVAIATGDTAASATALAGIAAVVYNAFRDQAQRPEIMRSPLAYAALAQERLG